MLWCKIFLLLLQIFFPNKARSIKLLWSDKSVKAENDKPRAPRLVSSLIRCRSWNDLLTSQPHCVEHVNLWFNCMFGAYIFYLALFSSVSSFPMSLPRPLLSCCCCSWCWLTSKLHRVSQHLLLHVIWHHLTLIPPRWHDVQTEEPVNVAGMCRSKEKTVKLQLLWTAEVYQCMKKKDCRCILWCTHVKTMSRHQCWEVLHT